MSISSFFPFQDQNWFENPNFFFQKEIHCKNGKVLERFSWNSEFEKNLQDVLQDPPKARRIEELYTSILLPEVAHNYALREAIESWLIEYAGFLGALPIDYKGSFHSNFKLAYLLNNPKKSAAIESFFQELQKREQKERAIVPTGECYRIAILTSKMGGGHVSVAKAVCEALHFDKQFEVTIVDTDETTDPSHPLTILTDSFSSVDFYNKFYQQEKNFEKMQLLRKAIELLRQFVPNRAMEALKKRIREINPNCILSTCAFVPEHAFLSSDLAIPLGYIHTDFYFHQSLERMIKKVHSQALSFFIPSADCRPNSGAENTSSIHILGYPVSSVFTRESDPKTLQKIRQQFGVQANEKVVVMMMGKYGAGKVLLDAIKQLLYSAVSLPIHIAFICGENSSLKAEIEGVLKRHNPQYTNLSFRVYATLTPQELAAYYKICDLLIGKAGGATVAEVQKMGVRLLECESHPWEGPNIDYLIKNSGCVRLKAKTPLLPQIFACFEAPLQFKESSEVDWRSLLKEKVVEIIHTHRQNPLPAIKILK
jgi:UDP-N-acetylglucosamine:LPS N-acetylglucosamine transferase